MKKLLYKLLRISNDVAAIKRGKVSRRIGRRVAGRIMGRIMRALFK